VAGKMKPYCCRTRLLYAFSFVGPSYPMDIRG
jgi:hypothetical protein